jgi:hypothetical protein
VRLAETHSTLETQDAGLIQSLSREALLGDLFYAGTLGYYAQYLALSHITGLNVGAHHYLAAGIGSVGYEPTVRYLFGLPRAIEPGGVYFDIPMLQVIGASDGNAEKQKNYTLQVGLLSSALEHVTPERMFDDPNDGVTPDAISAVKALQKANAQGQRIYRITQANMNAVLGNIHHDRATLAEIRNAVQAGREVITHTDSVSVPGWGGAGYIILDWETGEGAYKISGGNNGSMLIVAGIVLIALAITIGMFSAANAPLLAISIAVAEVLLLTAAAAFILAGISLVRGDLRSCSNYLTLAWSSLGIAFAKVVPGYGASIAATLGISVLTNDVNGQLCR